MQYGTQYVGKGSLRLFLFSLATKNRFLDSLTDTLKKHNILIGQEKGKGSGQVHR